MAQSQEHIFLRDIAKSERFTTTSIGGGKPNIPERDRISHSQYLISRFDGIRQQSIDENQEREAMYLPSNQLTYIEFKCGFYFYLIVLRFVFVFPAIVSFFLQHFLYRFLFLW